jgi:hypothetical protein
MLARVAEPGPSMDRDSLAVTCREPAIRQAMPAAAAATPAGVWRSVGSRSAVGEDIGKSIGDAVATSHDAQRDAQAM